MSYEERLDIVATVEETYALMGRCLGANIPESLIANAIRPDVLRRLQDAAMDQYVSDPEMLSLLLEAYSELVDSVFGLAQTLLGQAGEQYDADLGRVGLTGAGLRVKVSGFRRGLSRLPGFRWIKKTFEWGNIILGSLGAIPGVGIITEPIHELKEAIEAQGDDENRG
jgi:hypothetical protein